MLIHQCTDIKFYLNFAAIFANICPTICVSITGAGLGDKGFKANSDRLFKFFTEFGGMVLNFSLQVKNSRRMFVYHFCRFVAQQSLCCRVKRSDNTLSIGGNNGVTGAA